MAGKVLGLITARGGSKRVPRKSIRPFKGKPLLAWTIEAAKNCSVIDRLIVSTEDEEIADVARSCGCEVPFMRPHELASDHASSIEVTNHALEAIRDEFEWLIYLQPTSPLRTATDIDECFKACCESNCHSAISLSPVETSPVVMFTLSESGTIQHAIDYNIDLQSARSQDFPPYYAINGALYITKISWYKKSQELFNNESLGYIMPFERSINIDTELDFRVGEVMFEVCQENGML